MAVLTRNLIIGKTRAFSLDAVRNLNLWGNDLRDVSVLESLRNLEVCSLSVNCVENLEQFAGCANLTELYLRKNRISDISEVRHLAGLKKLRILWLCDNPCAQHPQYRTLVLKHLPWLEKLDNKDVTPEEVAEAKSLHSASREAQEGPSTRPAAPAGTGLRLRQPQQELPPFASSPQHQQPAAATLDASEERQPPDPAMFGDYPVHHNQIEYGRRKGETKEDGWSVRISTAKNFPKSLAPSFAPIDRGFLHERPPFHESALGADFQQEREPEMHHRYPGSVRPNQQGPESPSAQGVNVKRQNWKRDVEQINNTIQSFAPPGDSRATPGASASPPPPPPETDRLERRQKSRQAFHPYQDAAAAPAPLQAKDAGGSKKSHNVLMAVMTLIGELDAMELRVVRTEVEKQLAVKGAVI